MYKNIIFDLDGTLIDSLPDLKYSLNAALENRGLRGLDYAAVRSIIGYGAKNLCKSAYDLAAPLQEGKFPLEDEDGYEENLDALFEVYQEIYGQNTAERTVIFPGIKELLDKLLSRNLDLFVLSNKPHAMTVEITEKYFGKDMFKLILGEQKAYARKPDPAGIHYILKQTGAKAEETLFVGDGDTDMQTALAAGVDSLAVLWGYRDREDLEKSGAINFAADSRELENFIMYN